ncbi:RAMP superfamily CRISPR-associated protein [Calorimonas adulescens]|uniref:CRISPR type III-associated protein domain-containing protein n=1 Tax=Calorimonas adulescens TaxID=2606906 RepID=A0A5D8QG05_9THEO|nr:RAMP superfamily CRISPR-associated protein [Calorimonas adulescens]TZE82168.1 hypothetical protein FWJ32_06670 [Calorimonas adulescens]
MSRHILYTIETIEPVIISTYRDDVNSNETLPYITGSSVRGVIIDRLIKAGKNNDIKFLLDGSVLFSNLYPYKNEIYFIPAPISLFYDEDDDLKVYDFSCGRQKKDRRYKSLPSECFVHVSDDILSIYTPEMREYFHHQRRLKVEEAVKSYSNVFRYGAIKEGETFYGDVYCNDDYIEIVKGLMSDGDNVFLGRGKYAGYGMCKINIKGIFKDSYEYMHEVYGLDWESIEEGKPLRMTFLSNAILYDRYGRNTVKIDNELVSYLLKVDTEIIDAYFSTEIVGGFNNKWGMNLPQSNAIKAGSTFVLRSSQKPDINRLYKLMDEGVGERREEGFGRLIFNPNHKEELEKEKIKWERKRYRDNELPDMSEEERKNVEVILKRIWHERIKRKIISYIASLAFDGGDISNSQLNNLRLQLHKRRFGNGSELYDEINNYFKGLNKKYLDQYEKTFIGLKKARVKEFIDDICGKSENQFTNLLGVEKVKIKDISPSLSEEELTGFKVILIDKVLERLYRKNKGGE